MGVIADPSKYPQELSFIKEIINREGNWENSDYLYTIISQKLLNGENLDKLFEEEYNDYLNLKAQSEQWNKELDETKKVKSIDQWWDKYENYFVNLQVLDRRLSVALVLSFKDKGLLALQSYLKIYDEALGDEGIKTSVRDLIKRRKGFSPNQLDKLLQTAHAYKKMGKVAAFQEILSKEEDFQTELDHRLVEMLAESLEIQLDKQELSLDGWNKKYLFNLTSNEEMIKQKEDSENTLALYREMLKATFENRFDDFISSNDQTSEVGQDIARHNQHIKEVYGKLGIDWEGWLDYKKTQDFAVETEKEVAALPRFIELLKERVGKVREEIAFLEKGLTEREYLPLVHLLDGAKDKPLGNMQDYKKLKERYDNFAQRINALKEKYPNLDFSSIAEHSGHLREAIELFKEKDRTETETFSKGFRIRLWDRDPRKDLFQGNYTHCCIAVGVKPGEQDGGLNTHDPSTVMQFLVDKGIQVAEVLDESKEDPIAQVWLFVSKDNLGEPILVVDNFEVQSDYVSDVFINNQVRDNMFEFLRGYAKAMNIPKVGLAQVKTNDVASSEMPSFATSPIDKVGGYLKEYTLDVAGRKGRYYLEAYNNHNLAEIMNEQI